MTSIPDNWEKTQDKSGRLQELKSNGRMTVVLRYERKGEMNVTQEELVVIMEGDEYYWRYDDYSGGQLEYEYDHGSTHTTFDDARKAALKELQRRA